jgi:hypothetical protein
MIYLRTSIATFLANARALIYGIRDDLFIKERILPYAIDDARIAESVAAYDAAELAEAEKSKEFGERLEARLLFERAFEEAEQMFKEHTDFLKLTLRDDFEKQKKLFLIGVPRAKRIDNRLKHMREVYFRTLQHDEVVAALSRFGITREDLEAGQRKVVETMDARKRFLAEKGEAEDATTLRDEAFVTLFDAVEDLETVCSYALKDRPQLMEKLGIVVFSPGYRPKPAAPAAEEPQQ